MSESVAYPSDLDAEATLLASFLVFPEKREAIRNALRPEHFFSDANRLIYSAMLRELDASGDIEPMAVLGRLKSSGQLERVGGGAYLYAVLGGPVTVQTDGLTDRIRNEWAKRHAHEIGKRVAAQALNGVQDVRSWLDSTRQELERLTEDPRRPRTGVSVTDVLEGWRQSGPLVHESTGFPELDDLTGGGPVFGSRWYLAGAPDAGKTALLVQWAHQFAQRGIPVGLLAVDEDPDDIVTRLAQRAGYMRSICEIRDESSIAELSTSLGGLPLRIYDAEWTIEGAAADLARFARDRHAMLAIDSLQTVQCEAERVREFSEVAAVTARTKAIRAVATRYKMLTIATSELGRGAYRSSDPKEQTSTMAASKWSGAIEYSARVLIGVRSVAGEKDIIDLDIAKNKHGPRDKHVYLRLDRRWQTLSQVSYDPPQKPSAEERAEQARSRSARKVAADAAVVVRVLMSRPGMTVRELRAEVQAQGGIGKDRLDAALALLGDAIVRTPAAKGTGVHLTVEYPIPDPVREHLQ